MRTSSRFLLASVCGVALLGVSARAELRANDPHVRAALEDFERYAAEPKTASDTREKKPVTLAVVIGDFLKGGSGGGGAEDCIGMAVRGPGSQAHLK